MGTLIPRQAGEALPQEWDQVSFNGEICPGFAKVTVKRSQKWDDKKAKAEHGADRTFSGTQPAKVTIDIQLVTDDEHEDFIARILPIIDKNEKEKMETITFGHRAATDRKIAGITPDDLDGPNRGSDGIVTYKLSATETRPPSAKNAGGGMGAAKFPGQGSDCASCAQRAQQITAEIVDADAEYLSILSNPPQGIDDFFGNVPAEDQARLDEWQFRLQQALNRKTAAAQALAANADQQRVFGCNDQKPANGQLSGP